MPTTVIGLRLTAACICVPLLASFSLSAQAAAMVYARWLDEDVRYIISDQERAAFAGLGTEEEREQFIEQFWLRRDPVPATRANEYKEEHYRRIAYANERFGSGSLPGWRTDRGRIYIMYGPPDEIESHTGEQREAWRYRLFLGAETVIEFDLTGNQPARFTTP